MSSPPAHLRPLVPGDAEPVQVVDDVAARTRRCCARDRCPRCAARRCRPRAARTGSCRGWCAPSRCAAARSGSAPSERGCGRSSGVRSWVGRWYRQPEHRVGRPARSRRPTARTARRSGAARPPPPATDPSAAAGRWRRSPARRRCRAARRRSRRIALKRTIPARCSSGGCRRRRPGRDRVVGRGHAPGCGRPAATPGGRRGSARRSARTSIRHALDDVVDADLQADELRLQLGPARQLVDDEVPRCSR